MYPNNPNITYTSPAEKREFRLISLEVIERNRRGDVLKTQLTIQYLDDESKRVLTYDNNDKLIKK